MKKIFNLILFHSHHDLPLLKAFHYEPHDQW
uniref:Uncharacterized protein n=1 Tax=Amphimedon queenslandica TaxID=400682 RepID=A0A1X7VEH3_AMPQE